MSIDEKLDEMIETNDQPEEQVEEQEPVETEDEAPEQEQSEEQEPFDQADFIEKMIDKAEEPAEEPKEDKADVGAEKAEEKPSEDAPEAPKTEEDEEADLLKAIPSERGKERIRHLLRQGRESRAQVEAFQRTVQESGLDAESFTNLLTITKLCSSSNPADIEKGLAGLESVRANLYQMLGREAPGIDLLSGHDDLKSKVDDLVMTRDDALTLARARQLQQEQDRQRKEQEARNQEMAAYKKKVDDFQTNANAVFARKASDLDFNDKVAIMSEHFKQPGQLERFVRDVPPEQWVSTLEYMYDSIRAPKPAATPTPIAGVNHKRTGYRSRGNEAFDPETSVSNIMESMGL